MARKRLALEVQRNLRRHRSRSHVVSAAEGGEKVIQGVLVGKVDGRQVEVHLVALLVEDVVFADGRVEEVTRRDALRVC